MRALARTLPWTKVSAWLFRILGRRLIIPSYCATRRNWLIDPLWITRSASMTLSSVLERGSRNKWHKLVWKARKAFKNSARRRIRMIMIKALSLVERWLTQTSVASTLTRLSAEIQPLPWKASSRLIRRLTRKFCLQEILLYKIIRSWLT